MQNYTNHMIKNKLMICGWEKKSWRGRPGYCYRIKSLLLRYYLRDMRTFVCERIGRRVRLGRDIFRAQPIMIEKWSSQGTGLGRQPSLQQLIGYCSRNSSRSNTHSNPLLSSNKTRGLFQPNSTQPLRFSQVIKFKIIPPSWPSLTNSCTSLCSLLNSSV